MTVWCSVKHDLINAEGQGLDPGEAERDTKAWISKLDPGELLEYLLVRFGGRITAAGLGLVDAQPLKDWGFNNILPRDKDILARKVQTLFRILYPLTLTYSSNTAAAFLVRRTGYLDGNVPLVVLADDSSGSREGDLIGAMRALLY